MGGGGGGTLILQKYLQLFNLNDMVSPNFAIDFGNGVIMTSFVITGFSN